MELRDPGQAASGLFDHLFSEHWGQNYLSKRSLQGISKGSQLRNRCLACNFSLIKMNYSLSLPQLVLLSFKAQLFQKPLPLLSRVESLVPRSPGHTLSVSPGLVMSPPALGPSEAQAAGRSGQRKAGLCWALPSFLGPCLSFKRKGCRVWLVLSLEGEVLQAGEL